MSAPEAAPGLPRTTPAAGHAAASNPTARPQRLFFNGHKTGLSGGPREADPATSAPSAPVGVLPTAQSAPPTPQAMGPAAGTGGTRVGGVRCAASRGPWRGCGRGPMVRRRSRVFFARAEPEHRPGRGPNALKTFVSRGPRVGEQEKKALFSTSLLMKRAANCSSSSADGTLGRSGPPAHLLGAREIFMAVRNREYSRGGGSVDVPMNLDLVAEVVSLVRSNYDGRPAAGRRRHGLTPQGTSCPDLDRARALRCYSGTSIF